jgi:hypothetical protein
MVFDFTGRVHINTKLPVPVGWANDRYLDSGLDIADLRLELELKEKETKRGVRDRYFRSSREANTEWIFIGTKQDLDSIPHPNPSAIYGK